MPNHGTLEAWQTNETYQPLGNIPTGGYISKRNLFCNKPQDRQRADEIRDQKVIFACAPGWHHADMRSDKS